jgi:hypothetical protein
LILTPPCCFSLFFKLHLALLSTCLPISLRYFLHLNVASRTSFNCSQTSVSCL